MKQLFFIISLLLFCGSHLHGQTLDMGSMDFYQSRIGNMDQFFERFNGNDIPPDIDRNRADLRQLLILSCFEYDTASAYSQDVINFINRIISDSIELVFETTDWEAVAECEAILDKKNTDVINIRLRVETDTIGRFLKWSIVSAEGSTLELEPEIRASVFSMSPVAHELNFMELRKITSSRDKNILNYAYASFKPDMTTVFYQLVMSGRLKLGGVHNLKYLFNVGGWCFSVEFYNRETKNSGWLINRLVKINEN